MTNQTADKISPIVHNQHGTPEPMESRQAQSLEGHIKVPGDKSMSHRSLMFGTLAEGETIISGLLEGEDVLNTAEAMRKMGARINKGSDGLWRVFGVGLGNLKSPDSDIDMGNSGTSARLLIGLIGGHDITVTMTGDPSLSKRPMKRVISPLTEMGAKIEARDDNYLPLTIKGTPTPKAIEYTLPVASAQVKSALLLAGLNAEGKTIITEKRPTRDHTENMFRHFGLTIDTEETNQRHWIITLQGEQKFQPCAVDIPGDPSSAAFPVVACLINEGSELYIDNIGINPRRIGLYETLKDMGADLTFENIRTQVGEQVANLKIKYNGPLKGIDVPPERVPSMIDEFPILAVAASCAEGTTRMTGLAELRVKESDRLLMMAEGLKACGVNLEMGEESLTIHGTGKPPQGGASVKTALDHRIAMSFLILGTATTEPVSIDDGTPIRTSFPNFVELMNDLGTNITNIKEN